MPRPKSDQMSDRVRRMVHQRLSSRAGVTPASTAGTHLDEDALSAFIEGRLSNLESAPLVRHLVGCGLCRNITAQLVRLDTELSGIETETAPQKEEPGRIRSLLADLAARVFPSTDDDVVFAYHAPADDFEKKDKSRQDDAESEEKAKE